MKRRKKGRGEEGEEESDKGYEERRLRDREVKVRKKGKRRREERREGGEGRKRREGRKRGEEERGEREGVYVPVSQLTPDERFVLAESGGGRLWRMPSLAALWPCAL